jgi:hypothetical protein
MKMTSTLTVLGFGLLTVLASGCGKSKALMAAEEYEKAACACKDVACVTAATKAFSDAAKDMGTASSSEAEAITKASTNAAACAMKVTTANIPGMPKK